MTMRTFLQFSPAIAENVYIDETALVIGNVELAADVSVWPMAVLRGDVQPIKIGTRSNIQDGAVIHGSHLSEYQQAAATTVGEDVTVGHKVILHGCTIHNRCLIGMGSIILDHAIIQDEVMIGANSLVPPHKELASGYLYVGSPVRQVRPLTGKEKEFLRYSAEHYVKLKNHHFK